MNLRGGLGGTWEELEGDKGLAKLSVLMHRILKLKKIPFKPIIIDKGPSKDFCLRPLLAQEHLETRFFALFCRDVSSLPAPCLVLTDLFCLTIDALAVSV